MKPCSSRACDPGLFWFLLLSLLFHLFLFFFFQPRKIGEAAAPPLLMEIGEIGGGEESLAPKVPSLPRVKFKEAPPVKIERAKVTFSRFSLPLTTSEAKVQEVDLSHLGLTKVPGPPRDLSVPGFPKGGPGQAFQGKKDHSDYLSLLRKLIEAQKRYPLRARLAGYEGRVTLSFVVNKDGSVEGIRVISPSPYPVLNQAALKTIKRAAPFPPPPKDLDPPLRVRLTLGYRLKNN